MTRRRYDFARPARAALLDELIAGVPGFAPATDEVGIAPDGTACFVVCDEALAGPVAAVVAAHDPAAIDAAAAALVQQDAGDLAGFRAVYAALLADAATLEDTTQALTAQQLRNRLAALERIVARLARYAGRRLS